uniref:Uncharacterized protein n=1 Tax=Arcella intermedia TaxID=1963864 RepID=A0A6B2LD02_9EUKA
MEEGVEAEIEEIGAEIEAGIETEIETKIEAGIEAEIEAEIEVEIEAGIEIAEIEIVKGVSQQRERGAVAGIQLEIKNLQLPKPQQLNQLMKTIRVPPRTKTREQLEVLKNTDPKLAVQVVAEVGAPCRRKDPEEATAGVLALIAEIVINKVVGGTTKKKTTLPLAATEAEAGAEEKRNTVQAEALHAPIRKKGLHLWRIPLKNRKQSPLSHLPR